MVRRPRAAVAWAALVCILLGTLSAARPGSSEQRPAAPEALTRAALAADALTTAAANASDAAPAPQAPSYSQSEVLLKRSVGGSPSPRRVARGVGALWSRLSTRSRLGLTNQAAAGPPPQRDGSLFLAAPAHGDAHNNATTFGEVASSGGLAAASPEEAAEAARRLQTGAYGLCASGVTIPTGGSVSCSPSGSLPQTCTLTCSAGYFQAGDASFSCSDRTCYGSCSGYSYTYSYQYSYGCSPYTCGYYSYPCSYTTSYSCGSYVCGYYTATCSGGSVACGSYTTSSQTPSTCYGRTCIAKYISGACCEYNSYPCTVTTYSSVTTYCSSTYPCSQPYYCSNTCYQTVSTTCTDPVTCYNTCYGTAYATASGCSQSGAPSGCSTSGCSGSYPSCGSYSYSASSCASGCSPARSPASPNLVCSPCTKPALPTGASETSVTGSPPSAVSYACGAGYFGASVTRSCSTTDGSWSGSAPACTSCASTEPAIGAGNPGVVVVSRSGTPAASITYGCDAGFIPASTTRSCSSADGSWSGAFPVCMPATVSPTPSPSATPTTSASVSASASMSPSVTPSSTVTPSSSASATVSATPSSTVTPSASVSSSVTASASVSASVTPSASVSASVTASATVSSTVSASVSGSPSVTPSVSVTVTTSASTSSSASPSVTASASVSPSVTPSNTVTPSTSVTASASTSASVSVTVSASTTASVSPTTSCSASVSPSTSSSPSVTPSASVSSSVTPSASASGSTSPSFTPSTSVTSSHTPSASASGSISPSPSSSATPSASASATGSVSPSPSGSPSGSVTPTTSASASVSRGSSASRTSSSTASRKPSTSPSSSATGSTSPQRRGAAASGAATSSPTQTGAATGSGTPSWTATATASLSTGASPSSTSTASLSSTATSTFTLSASAPASKAATNSAAGVVAPPLVELVGSAQPSAPPGLVLGLPTLGTSPSRSPSAAASALPGSGLLTGAGLGDLGGLLTGGSWSTSFPIAFEVDALLGASAGVDFSLLCAWATAVAASFEVPIASVALSSASVGGAAVRLPSVLPSPCPDVGAGRSLADASAPPAGLQLLTEATATLWSSSSMSACGSWNATAAVAAGSAVALCDTLPGVAAPSPAAAASAAVAAIASTVTVRYVFKVQTASAVCGVAGVSGTVATGGASVWVATTVNAALVGQRLALLTTADPVSLPPGSRAQLAAGRLRAAFAAYGQAAGVALPGLVVGPACLLLQAGTGAGGLSLGLTDAVGNPQANGTDALLAAVQMATPSGSGLGVGLGAGLGGLAALAAAAALVFMWRKRRSGARQQAYRAKVTQSLCREVVKAGLAPTPRARPASSAKLHAGPRVGPVGFTMHTSPFMVWLATNPLEAGDDAPAEGGSDEEGELSRRVVSPSKSSRVVEAEAAAGSKGGARPAHVQSPLGSAPKTNSASASELAPGKTAPTRVLPGRPLSGGSRREAAPGIQNPLHAPGARVAPRQPLGTADSKAQRLHSAAQVEPSSKVWRRSRREFGPALVPAASAARSGRVKSGITGEDLLKLRRLVAGLGGAAKATGKGGDATAVAREQKQQRVLGEVMLSNSTLSAAAGSRAQTLRDGDSRRQYAAPRGLLEGTASTAASGTSARSTHSDEHAGGAFTGTSALARPLPAGR